MYIISNYMPHITSFWIFEDVADELVDCYLSHRIVALDLYIQYPQIRLRTALWKSRPKSTYISICFFARLFERQSWKE